MRFPPEVHPADATLSRISRELSKRMLCVYNLWKVRTLQYQLHTTQKKRKLAEGLYTEEAEDEDKIPHDWENYMDRLLTLLLAYAMAGVTPRASVKDARLDSLCGGAVGCGHALLLQGQTAVQHTASIPEAGMAGSSGP